MKAMNPTTSSNYASGASRQNPQYRSTQQGYLSEQREQHNPHSTEYLYQSTPQNRPYPNRRSANRTQEIFTNQSPYLDLSTQQFNPSNPSAYHHRKNLSSTQPKISPALQLRKLEIKDQLR